MGESVRGDLADIERAQARLRGRIRPHRDPIELAVSPVPRITVTQAEACAALSCSEEFFVEHIRPHMRVIRRGRKRLFPVSELERVVDELAESAL